jgi:hypothetical protein
MVAVHVTYQCNNIVLQNSNDSCEDLMINLMFLRNHKATHLFKWDERLGSFAESSLSLEDNVLLPLDVSQDTSRKSLNKNLNNSGSMDVQRNLNDLFTNSIHKLFHIKGVCLFHNSLAKVITELIDHDIGDNWSNGVDETFGEGLSLRRLRLLDLQGSRFLSAGALSDGVLDHLL